MKRRTSLGTIAVVLVIAGSACGEPTSTTSETARPTARSLNPAALVEGEPYEPDIDPQNFVDEIDNPYLPFKTGATLRYEGESDGENETTVVEVTDDKKTVMGIEATVVRDRVYVDDELAEDTFDWFAQDRDGNVWYLGEESKEIEDGKVASTEGSWEAGMDGALPGIVMLGDPRVGESYRQEYYKGEAEDAAKVIALDESVKVEAGSYENVLVTDDWNPLEPKVLERKYYARGVGVVQERKVKGGDEYLELVAVE